MISAKNKKYNIGDKILIEKHWYFKKGDITEILNISGVDGILWLKDTKKTFWSSGAEVPTGIATYICDNNISIIDHYDEDPIVIINNASIRISSLNDILNTYGYHVQKNPKKIKHINSSEY